MIASVVIFSIKQILLGSLSDKNLHLTCMLMNANEFLIRDKFNTGERILASTEHPNILLKYFCLLSPSL